MDDGHALTSFSTLRIPYFHFCPESPSYRSPESFPPWPGHTLDLWKADAHPAEATSQCSCTALQSFLCSFLRKCSLTPRLAWAAPSLGVPHSGSQAWFLVPRAGASKGREVCLFLTSSFPVTAQKVSFCSPLQGRKRMHCWDMTSPKCPLAL